MENKKWNINEGDFIVQNHDYKEKYDRILRNERIFDTVVKALTFLGYVGILILFLSLLTEL